MKSKTELDSEFHIVDSRFQVMEFGFWILIVSGIPDSLDCIPNSKAQDSGFHWQNIPGFPYMRRNSSLLLRRYIWYMVPSVLPNFVKILVMKLKLLVSFTPKILFKFYNLWSISRLKFWTNYFIWKKKYWQRLNIKRKWSLAFWPMWSKSMPPRSSSTWIRPGPEIDALCCFSKGLYQQDSEENAR